MYCFPVKSLFPFLLATALLTDNVMTRLRRRKSPHSRQMPSTFCTMCSDDAQGLSEWRLNRCQRQRRQLPPVSTTPAANLPLVSTTPTANFATSSACVVDTGGKFVSGVNDTGGKFATSIIDTSGKFATGVYDTDDKQWEQYQTADNLK
jgi:hypothetical protein